MSPRARGVDIEVSFGGLPREIIKHRFDEYLVRAAAAEAINFAGPFVAGKLAQNTPVGATGKARQSVTFEPAHPTGRIVTGFVGYGAPASLYIGFANDGTRAHFPPITPLTYWAARKLGDANLGWAIARHISKFGTKPQKFVEKTRREVEVTAGRMMAEAFMAHFRLGGG